jgi:hypothetical protein
MSAPIRFTFSGGPTLKKNMEKTAREMPLAARRGAREWAQEFLSEIIPGVPFKTGKLASSGRVRISIKKTAGKENVGASIVFGGASVGVLYAKKVHEDNPKHPDHEKYLERPLLAKVPVAGREIAEKVNLKRVAIEAGAAA